MTTPQITRAMRRAAAFVLVAIVVLSGAALRVRYLEHEMLSRWRGSLEGGAATAQATVDEWFADRKADAQALAVSVAVHAAFPQAGDGSPRFSSVLAPVARRGKFVGVWVVDSAGSVLASSAADTLRAMERLALTAALRSQRTTRSMVMPLGPHGALLAIAAPVHLTVPATPGTPAPAAVVVRADIVTSFSSWAAGRPNAALSHFSTPATDGAVLISACPEQDVPVCISQHPSDGWTPTALALAAKDTFGIFTWQDGERVLAVTRFDQHLEWGVIRAIRYRDAVVPLNRELAIEGAFLAVLLALAGVGALAVNRTIRVRRLDANRDATERLSIVVDASTDGIISLDEHFAITMVNGAVERILGFSRSALVGQPVFSLFAAEWHAHLMESLQDFARSTVAHAPLGSTERCLALCADGRLLPVDARVGRAVVHGVPLYVVGLRDVADAARTEVFLQGQRHVLEMIASGAPSEETLAVLLSVVHREAPGMQYVVYELDEERQVARIVSDPGLDAGIVAAIGEVKVGPDGDPVGTALHRGESVFSSDIGSDPLWSASSALLVAHGIHGGLAIPLRAADGRVIGGLACFYGEAREPTARERELARLTVHLSSIALASARDAAALRASEASFRSFVENAPAAIFREMRSGGIVSTNAAMLELLGYADITALSSVATAGGLYHDAAARTRLLRALESGDVAPGVETEWRRADASLVTVRLSARAYRDDAGEVWLWDGYAENVTSLRAAEEALRRSERLAAVGQLISGVAHELNNPLSSIMHFAEDLLTDQRSTADAEALGVIRDQARRSRAIVRDLLSFVRQREANALPMSLGDVVAATVRAMGPALSESGVQLHLAPDSENPVVMADRSGVEQIVTNLVSNAAHAAGRGGHVWVGVTRDETTCQLVVDDSGPGILDDILPRIFDPFFTTKQTGEGTGLGLSVTLGIVEQLGGRIAVCPRPGGTGTRFTVRLSCVEAESGTGPASPAERPQPKPASEAALTAAVPTPRHAPTGGADAVATELRALVIDDEPTIRAALRRYFTRRGWLVEEAADGLAGLALLEHHGDRIAVVISDLRMPGFSGIELHDRLATAHPALLRKCIFSTGDVASPEAATFVERTSCPVLQKPFELRMLDEIIAGVRKGEDEERVVA